LGEQAGQIRGILDERISRLEEGRIKTIGEVSKVNIRLLDVEKEVPKIAKVGKVTVTGHDLSP